MFEIMLLLSWQSLKRIKRFFERNFFLDSDCYNCLPDQNREQAFKGLGSSISKWMLLKPGLDKVKPKAWFKYSFPHGRHEFGPSWNELEYPGCNDATSKVDSHSTLLISPSPSLSCPPKTLGWASRGSHSEILLLYEFFCGTLPSCLKVWGGWWWVVVAYRILVSAQALSHCHWAWVIEPESLSLVNKCLDQALP